MADAREHGAFVLGAILPDRVDLLQRAMRVLVSEHFIDSSQSTLFSLLSQYHDKTGGVLTESALTDTSRNIDSGRAQIYYETYMLFLESSVGEEQFEWSLEQMRELHSESQTSEALATAMTILRKGQQVSGEDLKGAEDARSYLGLSLTQIDRQMTMQAAPEGDVRNEQKEILADYQARKEIALSGGNRGVLFGIDALDSKIGGLQRGEVVLIAGYSSDGKTTMLTQLAWHAAVEQQKNVVFFTTETLREQVRRKLLARHSMLARFELGSAGLNSHDIKNGTLGDMEPKLEEVVKDFTDNPDYGILYIKQVPRGASLTYIEQSLASLGRKFDVDLVCIDYLALLTSDRSRGTMREELASIMKESKQVATSAFGGKGVPLVSPWQVSRAAREKASDVGKYTSASLSETAEATNTADLIVSMLAPIDNSERRVQIDMQILKNRDGPTANDIRVEVDYGTSWFRSRRSLTAEPLRATSTHRQSSGEDLDELMNI